MFYVVCVLLSVLLSLYYVLKPRKSYDIYNDLPGAPTLPLLGNALDFTSSVAFFKTLDRYSKLYGETFKVQIGPVRKAICTIDPKVAETILTSMEILKKSDDYYYLKNWLGTGLLTSDGVKWKKHRRILTPAFHFQILDQFIDVFESCGEALVKKLETEDGNPGVDVYPYITLYSLDVICETIMGTNLNAQAQSDSLYVKSVREMGRIVMERTLSPIQMYDKLYRFTRNYYSEQKALKILHDQSNKVIKERKIELNRNKETSNADKEFFKIRKPFLDLLLGTVIYGEPISEQDIREEVDTFMFEGHDSTSAALAFTLYCLANNTEVQEKVFQEQVHLFGQKNCKVTYNDLQNMKYLELVIKESLRLYPPVPIIGRQTNSSIEIDGKKLPDGDSIVLFVFGLHRNPKYFENPEKFDPSRFETGNSKTPYTHLPFSAGPRNCIGQKFVLFQLKSIISKILRKFELKPATPKHDLILASETILKSINGVKLRLSLRHYQQAL